MWPRWSINVSALVILFSVSAGQVAAHGFINSPPSRAALCKQGKAKGCGAIQYEPQSVEAPKGMPFKVSGNGKLCSAGVDRFLELDKQGAKAWPHQSASSLDSFSWTILANHATTDFSYYMTKPNWDSTKSSGLVASDLESTPFLKVPMNGKPPGSSVTHKVDNLPSRKGYHMVYAVWTIADTGNAFYQCLDLDFGGGNSNSVGSGSSSGSGSGSGSNGQDEGDESDQGSNSSGGSSSSDPKFPIVPPLKGDKGGQGSNSSSSANTTPVKNVAAPVGHCKTRKSRRGVYKRADYRRRKPVPK